MTGPYRPTPVVELSGMTIALLAASAIAVVLALIGAATLVEAAFRYFR